MTYTIQIREETPRPLLLFPQSTQKEILQNAQIILTTPKGSVPLDRDFGIDFSILDKNLIAAENLFVAEVVDVLAAYEPRIHVEQLHLEQDENQPGVLKPSVEVRLDE